VTVAWRNEAPRLTAADVDPAAFPLTPWGRRGYDQAAVDALLTRIRDELMMSANEATGLREEVMRLRRRFVATQRGDAGEWLADAEGAHAMAVHIVSEAQATADRYVTDAQEYAGRIAGDAQGRREEILAEAERVLADARAQARDAADAALDEPVPDPAGGTLRAARAQAAYDGKYNGVYLEHVSLNIENIQHQVSTVQRMLANWRRKELGAGPEPAPRPPLPAEIPDRAEGIPS
jgi:DivIVA domain-containing protein